MTTDKPQREPSFTSAWFSNLWSCHHKTLGQRHPKERVDGARGNQFASVSPPHKCRETSPMSAIRERVTPDSHWQRLRSTMQCRKSGATNGAYPAPLDAFLKCSSSQESEHICYAVCGASQTFPVETGGEWFEVNSRSISQGRGCVQHIWLFHMIERGAKNCAEDKLGKRPSPTNSRFISWPQRSQSLIISTKLWRVERPVHLHL